MSERSLEQQLEEEAELLRRILYCPKCGKVAENAWADGMKVGIVCKVHGAIEVLFTEPELAGELI